MDQRQAYEKIQGIVDQINALVIEAEALAADHDIEFAYSKYVDLVDPDDAWESSDTWDDSGC